MKKIKLKRPYYINKDDVEFMRPHEWEKYEGVKQYSMWPEYERKLMRRCDEYIKWFRANPPGISGWLTRGIAKTRMLKVKREVEQREECRTKIQRENERGRAVSVF